MKHNIKQVLSVRKYKAGYHIIEYIVDGSKYGSVDVVLKQAFTSDTFQYIGEPKWAYRLTHKFHLTQLQSVHRRETKPPKKDYEKAKQLLLGNFLSDYSFNTVNLGFSENEKKWYGWSHRAIFGFGVGSSVKPGDCAYKPCDKEDFIRTSIEFWKSESHKNVQVDKEDTVDGRKGVWISWIYCDNILNKNERGKISGVFSSYPEEWGKGSWTAQTLDDAKQMAVDFAEGVS